VNIEDAVSDRMHQRLVLTLLVIISVSSFLVEDLRLVFGVIGSFSEAISNFVCPGLFLYATELKLVKAKK
jgi:hypothetical protein